MERSDRTTLTLPLVDINHAVSGVGHEKGPEKGPEKEPENNKSNQMISRKRSIMDIIKDNSAVSRKEISDILSLTDNQVKKTLDSLKREGYIHHEGPAKGGKWVVDKDYIQ